MGASQSKADNEQVFYNPVPIQVSPELASQLSDATLSPDVSPARQAALDASVRAKISAEVARLHEGDDVLRREIEAALERENLDRERSMAGDVDEHGDIKNSTALLGDLEEVRQKVDRYRARASLADHPDVKKASEAVASCYRELNDKSKLLVRGGCVSWRGGKIGTAICRLVEVAGGAEGSTQ